MAVYQPIERLAMQGPPCVGDGGDALCRLADYFDACLLAPA
ncbi:MAG: hypothetical protein ABJD24_13485 [Acidimicrobiales bacterium]